MTMSDLIARCCRLSVPAALLAALAVAGCRPAEESQKTKEAPRVTVAHPTLRTLVDEDDYSGWLEASQTVDVRSRVRGHIQEVLFKDGDLVQKDQLLFELDPRPFQAAVDQALAQAKALEAQKVAADKNVARQAELLKANAVAASEYEQTLADAQSFTARIAAQMQVVETHKLDLEYARITAPIAGRIGRAMLTKGNLVNAGGTDPILATIVAVDPIYVDFNVDERAIQRYQGMSSPTKDDEQKSLRQQKIGFSFKLDTDKGYSHKGTLIFADNKYTPGTGTILLRGVTENAEGRLIPGSRVRVRIPVSDEYQAVIVPDEAILADQERRYLLVVGKDNVVEHRDITLGRLLDDGMRVILPAADEKKSAEDPEWIESWLQRWVIINGLLRARQNYPVQPMDAEGRPAANQGSAK